MIGCNMLNAINKRLQQAFPESADQVFGGCSVMLFGDFGELTPVGVSQLYHSNIVNPNAVLGQPSLSDESECFLSHTMCKSGR